jgi:hypothetical protein
MNILGCCCQHGEKNTNCLGVMIEEDCPVGKLLNSEIVWIAGKTCESCESE